MGSDDNESDGIKWNQMASDQKISDGIKSDQIGLGENIRFQMGSDQIISEDFKLQMKLGKIWWDQMREDQIG